MTNEYAVSDIESPHEWFHPENPCAYLTLDLRESIQYKELVDEIAVRWLAEREEEEREEREKEEGGISAAKLEKQKKKGIDDKNNQMEIPEEGEREETALADCLSGLTRTFAPVATPSFFFGWT